jgi:hypothetical protein
VLVASGWTKEEIKESSWALIQFKSLPTTGAVPSSPSTSTPNNDARTAERWLLVEEMVPTEYRQDLLEGKVGLLGLVAKELKASPGQEVEADELSQSQKEAQEGASLVQ